MRAARLIRNRKMIKSTFNNTISKYFAHVVGSIHLGESARSALSPKSFLPFCPILQAHGGGRSLLGVNPNPNAVALYSVFTTAEPALNPLWVIGFTDAEGCFTVIISQLPSQKHKITASFEINLHVKDSSILYKIQSFFKVGNVYIRKDKKLAVYRVTKRADLINVIIPFFHKYPLLTAKYKDYIIWADVVKFMENGLHKTNNGFEFILSHYACINRGATAKKVLASFPNIVPTGKNIEQSLPTKLNPYWVSGFVAGDGGFHVHIRNDIRYKMEFKVDYSFSITQHNKDLKLMNLFIEFFNCGSVVDRVAEDRCDYIVQDKNSMLTKIIPHFTEYELQNIKQLDFLEFKEIMLLVNSADHLTEKGLNKIKELISNIKIRRDPNYEGKIKE